jgi:hypothetical protein
MDNRSWVGEKNGLDKGRWGYLRRNEEEGAGNRVVG